MTGVLSSSAQHAHADAGRLVGTAIVYNQRTVIRTPFGEFDEVIKPWAAGRALRHANQGGIKIALLRDHVSSLLLARATGTLDLIDGPLSVRMRARLADTELGRETVELVRRGDLAGMSFAAVFGERTWHRQQGTGRLLAVIHSFREIFDVSVVTYPAYPQTTVQVDTPHRRALDRRMVSVEALIARTGGVLATYGEQASPPIELARWCRAFPVRRRGAPAAA